MSEICLYEENQLSLSGDHLYVQRIKKSLHRMTEVGRWIFSAKTCTANYGIMILVEFWVHDWYVWNGYFFRIMVQGIKTDAPSVCHETLNLWYQSLPLTYQKLWWAVSHENGKKNTSIWTTRKNPEFQQTTNLMRNWPNCRSFKVEKIPAKNGDIQEWSHPPIVPWRGGGKI